MRTGMGISIGSETSGGIADVLVHFNRMGLCTNPRSCNLNGYLVEAHSHSHSHTHTLTHTLTHSLTHSLSLTLSHTHTHPLPLPNPL